MSSSSKKMIIGGAVLIAAVAYLGYSGVRAGGSYYTDVDTFMADANSQAGRVRLCGKVGRDDLVIDPSGTSASFRLEGEKSSVPVKFTGSIPDLFEAGGEVVVEGQLDDKGVFQAKTLLTKCASKYKPASADGNDSRRPT